MIGTPRLRRFRLVRTAVGTLRIGVTAMLSTALCMSTPGCRHANPVETAFNDTSEVDSVMARVDRPVDPPVIEEPLIQPVTLKMLSADHEPEYVDVTLDHILGVAMMNSEILRDLGATVLRSPQTLQTRYSRVLQESDPRFGMEAALSAFDAQLQATANFQDNNRIVNNTLLSGTNSLFIQDRHDYVAQISKFTATGGQLAIRNITDYDNNNAISNLLSNSWQTIVEGEIRQPLLQGGGLTFNRIAGPNAIPGVSNGVLIAKVNNDITAVDFERGLRDYVSDVVNAYWDLYFSYRDLDAKRIALTRSRETWQAYHTQQEEGRESAAAEALAREQYFRFRSELEDAIAGKLGQRTQEYNGITGGVFRGVNGVQVAERRLRLLIGMAVNDGTTLRPVDDPEEAPVVFDWDSIANEALRRRPEVRSQRLLVKRRELELLAARNFLAPRLDATATYRLRGLGHDLAGDDDRAGLGSAYSELGSGQYREWAAGLEFSMPLGFRRGSAGVNNAEFYLARDRALLREQERQVIHDLSNTIAESDRAYEQVEINLNRYLAAQDALEGLEANRREGLTINLEQLLDIQRRLTEAQSRYYLSRVEYAVALKNVHVEKGSVLEYADLHMVDSMAPIAAAMDAQMENMPPVDDAAVPESQAPADDLDDGSDMPPQSATPETNRSDDFMARVRSDDHPAVSPTGHETGAATAEAENPFAAKTAVRTKSTPPKQAVIRISSKQPTPTYSEETKDLFEGVLGNAAASSTPAASTTTAEVFEPFFADESNTPDE